ncbi:protein CYSTEINE-RICH TRANSMEMBRANE MODULE 11-like [Lycium barbarum]|uniref:protein CYSTEINE-RICH TRANSMEMBRANE MODULE 11-like n=1 Tax=Lycium barbarum TaxID=112863 RepID=UPI00293E8D6C|nr:protein CYSTEINE-RICH TRANSMEMBRANE MODULE 11-like [Lycium barbarum]
MFIVQRLSQTLKNIQHKEVKHQLTVQSIYPAPAPGYYEGPPVMAPPMYTAAPPPSSQPGFLEACLATLCCCCLLDSCCWDPFLCI